MIEIWSKSNIYLWHVSKLAKQQGFVEIHIGIYTIDRVKNISFWPKVTFFETFFKNNSIFVESNGQSEIVSFCLVFRALLQINSTASWPTVPPPLRRPVGFWNLKIKFKCCGGCHRSWNRFYTWNRWKNVYEKQMNIPSKSQISPLRPIKNWEKH